MMFKKVKPKNTKICLKRSLNKFVGHLLPEFPYNHGGNLSPRIPGLCRQYALTGESCWLTCLKESLDMFEEPRLVPGANLVQLSRLAAVNQVASHHHRLLLDRY